MDGTFIDPNTAGGWGEAEQPERADYGNASTDRLKECAFEAQERSNKSSVLPLLAVKCLGFHSMTKSETCAEYQAAAVDKHIRVAFFHVNKHIKSLSIEQTPRRSPPTSAFACPYSCRFGLSSLRSQRKWSSPGSRPHKNHPVKYQNVQHAKMNRFWSSGGRTIKTVWMEWMLWRTRRSLCCFCLHGFTSHCVKKHRPTCE